MLNITILVISFFLTVTHCRPQTDYQVKVDEKPRQRYAAQQSLFIGECGAIDDSLIYVDNTIVENSGPGQLNGTIEIYIDAPVAISCVKVQNQVDDETAATPALNSGGLGQNWVFIDVSCKYNEGFHFLIEIFGKYTTGGREIQSNAL